MTTQNTHTNIGLVRWLLIQLAGVPGRLKMNNSATNPNQEIRSLLLDVAEQPIDRISMDQDLLDLANKARSSLFSWRGQFSPELVEFLLCQYAQADSVVLDPFAGSGTTLFEASRRHLCSYGAEINPAAFAMTSTVHFVNIPRQERKDWLSKAETVIEKFFPPEINLFTWSSYNSNHDIGNFSFHEAVQELTKESSSSNLLHTIIANTIMRYVDYSGNGNRQSIHDAFRRYSNIVNGLPHRSQPAQAL